MLNQSITPAVKSHLESQLSFFTELSKKMFDSAQKVNELNIQAAQSVMEESINSAHQALGVRDPAELLSIAASQAQPVAETVRNYQQSITRIAAGTQAELVKTAESHIPETSRTAAAVVDEVGRNANEATQKATDMQKKAMDKIANPIIKPRDENVGAQGRTAH